MYNHRKQSTENNQSVQEIEEVKFSLQLLKNLILLSEPEQLKMQQQEQKRSSTEGAPPSKRRRTTTKNCSKCNKPMEGSQNHHCKNSSWKYNKIEFTLYKQFAKKIPLFLAKYVFFFLVSILLEV